MTNKRLNQPLFLEAPEQAPDGAGGFEVNWRTLGQLWAAVEARTGRFRAGTTGLLSVSTFRVTVRAAAPDHSSRPLAGQRFLWGQRVLRIEAVHEADGDARYLECHCEEEIAP